MTYFSERAKADGVTLKPAGMERDMNLAHRLYWEHNENREFSIAWADAARPRPDGFVKSTGLNDERRLLYVFSAVGCGFEPLLWRLYRGWMHEELDEELAIALLDTTPVPLGGG